MAVVGAFIFPHPPLIIPSVGKGQERAIEKTIAACDRAARQIARLKPETIVVTTPHSALYADYFHISPGEGAKGSFSAFGSREPETEFRYDREFVSALEKEASARRIPAGTKGEKDPSVDHGALVPLSFVNRFLTGYRLVRCSVSGMDALAHYEYGRCLANAAERLSRRVVLIASGDLSHKLKTDGPYGFAPQGPEFDRKITRAMRDGDFLRFLTMDPDLCEASAECGLPSFQILAGALDGQNVEAEFFSYEGPFGVGYAVCAFSPEGPNENRQFGRLYREREQRDARERREREDVYTRLARLSLETWVIESRRAAVPAGVPEELTGRRAGVFVSLKKRGRLRGCIGTLEPSQSCIEEEILHNAVSAGTRDPRFPPVTEEELPMLVYSVDVLGNFEPIDSVGELDVKRYGVLVRSGTQSGVLLPDLAGVDTPEEQVHIALRKAGIPQNHPFTMERFEVVRHT